MPWRKGMKPALTALALLLAAPSQAETVGLVADFIPDGDTLSFQDTVVRLEGIDAPEKDQTCFKAGVESPCGEASRRFLQELVWGRPLVCAGGEHDRYGRLLAICRLPDGRDIGEELVKAGHALAYHRYSLLYLEAEKGARDGRRGMWAGLFIRPEAWRRGARWPWARPLRARRDGVGNRKGRQRTAVPAHNGDLLGYTDT